MNHADLRMPPPRVVALGAHRTLTGAVSTELPAAIGERVDLRWFPASGWVRALRHGACALGRDRGELLHLFDPALLPVAALLRARYGVPVSVTADGAAWRRLPRIARRLDQVFVDDLDRARAFVAQPTRVAVAHTPPIAPVLPAPSPGAEGAFRGMMRGTGAARLALGLLWPSDREHVRWFKDAVLPLLFGEPTIVLLGAPNRRDPRLLLGRVMSRTRVRAKPPCADEIAAAARYVDAFVVPAPALRALSQDELLLALAASGVPVVAGAAVRSPVLEHEHNALLVAPGDAMGLASTLNKLLTLPAMQRHYLGQDFAEASRGRWTAEAAAGVYAERFAALVGRPRIPTELLRAA